MTAARPADYAEEAEELLPWAPVDDDALAYRRERIASALAATWNRGYQQGRADR